MPRTTIRAEDITDSQVGSAEIATGAVDSAEIATNAVTATEIAATTITPAQMASSAFLANRNIFINGAMLVSQRNTSVAAVTTNGYYTVDRMRLSTSSMGTWTIAQETLTSGNAFADGFQKAFRMDCTTANASPAAANNLAVQCKMEGYTLQGLKKGTANAKSFTVSFWVKSNLTGNYNFFVKDRDNSRQAIQLYTISAADTWEKKTITFTGDTTGVLGCDANSSLEFWWMLGSGTDYSSGTRPTGWEAGAVWANTGVGNVNLASSTDNDWAITGVQFEIGDTATPFEHRRYGAELWECQRYYQRVKENWWAYCTAAAVIDCFVQLTPDMRAAPSVTLDDTTPTVQKVNVANYTGSSSAITASSLNTTRGFVRMNGFSGLASNSDYLLVSTPFYFDAEL